MSRRRSDLMPHHQRLDATPPWRLGPLVTRLKTHPPLRLDVRISQNLKSSQAPCHTVASVMGLGMGSGMGSGALLCWTRVALLRANDAIINGDIYVTGTIRSFEGENDTPLIHTDRQYRVRVSTSPVREHRVRICLRYATIRDPELALGARHRAHEINTIRMI